MWFVIPARKGSKQFPEKNRYLINYTLDIFANSDKKNVVITTNDNFLIQLAKKRRFLSIKRDESLATDFTPMKDVIKDIIKKLKIDKNDDIIVLYPTYPQRTLEDINKIYKFYLDNKCNSLLCRKKIKTHPYMCYHYKDEYFGESIINHELYRRQDYPKCFEMSHFVCILKPKVLSKLNNQLMYKNTYFYDIDDVIDVDTKDEFKRTNC